MIYLKAEFQRIARRFKKAFFSYQCKIKKKTMKEPWVYMCSPSRSPFPPRSPPTPFRSSQCTRSERLSHAHTII